jgi:hypothetical protein
MIPQPLDSPLEHRNDEDVLIAMRDACGLLKLREAPRERFRAAIGKVRGGTKDHHDRLGD